MGTSECLTKPQVDTFVDSLSPELKSIFRIAKNVVLCSGDTLDDEFQMAAEVVGIFERYTKRKLGGE